ncbi:cell wall protein [Paenibacillus sp. LMG 31461]|uniref:Cell wall protein n=1 Tax=Paenibacillus plantarum TaxID=2654975 RepID=A0ABX1X5P3_9BACL|nr:collagen binding domain-containing protein [Paenibacillus plantarum]NOU63742.1 cell wall protein [Paenibacillus plantarum]
MVKKQTKAMLIALLMFMQCLYGITLSSQVNATEISGSILDSVTLAVYDSNGQVVTGNVYDQNAQAKLDYTWSLPNGHGYHNGDTFTFTLPQEFVLFNNVSGPLVIDNSSTVGNFHADKDSHHVVITFNEFIESHDDLKGTLSFLTQFNKSQITGTTEQTIVIPIRSGDQIFTIKFKPNVDSTISKSGAPLGYNAKSIDWTVDVNKTLDTVQDAVVTDPIIQGLAVPVTVAVYQLNVQLNGTVIQGVKLDSSSYAVSTEGGVLRVQFTESPITSAYRIQFSTPITDMFKTSFTNTASFSGSNKEPVQASSTVSVLRGNMLMKEATKYDPITQTMEWAILYNGGEEGISQSEAILTDLFDNIHQLVGGTIHVYKVTLNSSGVPTLAGEVSTDKYTVSVLTGAGKTGFKLQFLEDISSAYKIIYKTKATGPIYEDGILTNKVSTGENSSTTVTKPYTQVGIVKTRGDVNYQSKIVGWQIVINGDSQEMDHVVVTDTFPSKGLRLIPDSLVVKKGNVILTSPADYTLDSSIGADVGFTLTFTDPISQPIKITYDTAFNLELALPLGSANVFTNQGTIDWISQEQAHTKTVTAEFNPYNEVKKNGFKSGTYNAVNKQITWSVGINYNGKSISEAKIEDMLESGQTLLENSLVIHKMLIAPSGGHSLGDLVDPARYHYEVTPQKKLIITFLDPISEAYTIDFITSLENQLITNKVLNTAKLFDGSTQVSKDLTAAVNIPHGGEYVSKNGSQNGDKINWQITVNQGQSKLSDAEIFDTPSSNQVLVSDSFHLFSMKASANGDLTKDIELVEGVGYTVDIQTDATGNQTFRLKFKSLISTAFVLEYQSVIAARDQESITNAVSFSGNNVQTITKETVKDIVVGVSSGSGTGNGVRGSLEVKKVDASNKELPLSGAIYELYRKSGETKNLIQTQTTNEAGIAFFQGLLAGDYVIKETTAPSGYTLDGSEYPFTLQSAENKRVTYTNSKTPTPTPTPPPSSTSTPPPTSTPTPTSPPTPTPSSTPTPSTTPSPSITPTPKPSPPAATVPSPKPSDPGVVAPPTMEPATLPVTGESSHLYVKLAGLTFVLFGIMLGRKVRRRR